MWWLKPLGKFSPAHRDNKGERGVLLTLTNPWYKDILAKYDHLRGVEIDDVELKREFPVHWILGTSEYARIKTETTPKMGKPGEPIAELTRFGWTLMSSGSEQDLTKMFLTQTSRLDAGNGVASTQGTRRKRFLPSTQSRSAEDSVPWL